MNPCIRTTRTLSFICWLGALGACSGGDGPTEPDDRTTDTFEFTNTRLGAQGGLIYPAGTELAHFDVAETGLVEASVSIGPDLDCEYAFYIAFEGDTGNAILTTQGGSRMLSLEGEFGPGSYFIGVVGRNGGVSLCNGIPAEGVDFPHTITVTHP